MQKISIVVDIQGKLFLTFLDHKIFILEVTPSYPLTLTLTLTLTPNTNPKLSLGLGLGVRVRVTVRVRG